MSKAPPYFNFYYNDWIGGTYHMDHTAKSCYLALLIYQWQNGSIPDRKRHLMDICGITDHGQWDNVWEVLRDKFEPISCQSRGNLRMHQDREHSISVWNQRRSASKKASTVRSTVRSIVRGTVPDKDKDKDISSLSSKRSDATTDRQPVTARAKFTPPTVSEVQAYVDSKGWSVDAQDFCDFYESKGWKVGSALMKNWQAAVSRARTWESNSTRGHAVIPDDF